jgi:uncharacterized protein (TIGR02594 family)
MAILKKGSSGAEVRRLQMLLNAQLVPSPRLKEDGGFGDKTHEAVMRFQRQRGLTADGVVGPATWLAVGQVGRATPLPPTPVTRSWMDTAKAELGVHEDALPGQHTLRILEYHKTTTLKATTDETPWCSSFVNWVMIRAGHKGTNSAAARSWLEWGTKLTTPREGAITVLKKKVAGADSATGSNSGFHVAFYVSESSTHVRLLGGNQSDQVKYSNFALSAYDIKAMRWPG